MGSRLQHAVRFSPRPCHRWRSFLLSAFGAKMGKGCHVYSNVKIWAPWNLVIEDEAGIADGVTLYSMAAITVGRRVVISQGRIYVPEPTTMKIRHSDSTPCPLRLAPRPGFARSIRWSWITIGEGAVSAPDRSLPKMYPPGWFALGILAGHSRRGRCGNELDGHHPHL